MMTSTSTSTDLQAAVELELVWDPQIDDVNIGVTSDDGVVTLTGFVPNYAQRFAAERAALRVQGVRAVANDLVVKLLNEHIDPDIAHSAADALKHNVAVPSSVKVTVRDGHVQLEGTCEWEFQRRAAESAVHFLPGVRGLTDLVRVVPRVSPAMVESKIADAFRRNADLDAKHVTVYADGSTVRLTGRVRTFGEREEAGRAAWFAPGVSTVKNDIVVGL